MLSGADTKERFLLKMLVEAGIEKTHLTQYVRTGWHKKSHFTENARWDWYKKIPLTHDVR